MANGDKIEYLGVGKAKLNLNFNGADRIDTPRCIVWSKT